MLSGNPVSSEILLGPCCPEFNSGGRTRTGLGVGVRPEVGLAQVRTFAKLLVTHGFRLGVLYLLTTEYGLDGAGVGLGNGVGSKGLVGRERRLVGLGGRG